MSMLAIDIGHRYGRIGRIGSDDRPVVATAALAPPYAPEAALTTLLGIAPDGVDPATSEVVLGMAPSEGQELALLRAAEATGLTVRHPVAEPVAVALHYGAVAEGVDRTVLVCDQGATRLDLTVLTITPDRTVRIVETRSHRLGGVDWDEALTVDLRRQLPSGGDLLREAERLRRELAGQETAAVTVSHEGRDHELTLDRQTLDHLVAPLRERALAAVAEALAASLPEPGAVLLAGGLSATPGTAEALEAGLGLTVRCTSPELAVVHGLLALRDFGPLRVLHGRSATVSPRTTTAPFPGKDPEPRRWELREDPEPSPSGGKAGWAPGHAPDPGPAPAQVRDLNTAPAPDSGVVTGTTTGPGTTTEHARPGTRPVPKPEPAPAPESVPHHPVEAGPQPAPEPPETAPTVVVPAQGPLVAVPVEHLQAIRRGEHLLVLWAWPPGALTARVRWRVEGGGPTTPLATGDIRCKRRVYEHDGGLDLPVGRGAVTLTVEALVHDPGVDCEGSSSLRVSAEPPVVEYEPSVRRSLKGRVATVTFSCATGCELPALRIVHGVGRYRPTSTAEGSVLHETAARRLPARTPLSIEFPFPATRDTSWLVCFPADANDDSGIDLRPTALHRLRVT